ncbi:MAG TPA: hypothetical protein VMA95_09110 [Streptosporangiaceae bacterium]|nr:hypothetical protein [Streptosporangiaceae bacterium]
MRRVSLLRAAAFALGCALLLTACAGQPKRVQLSPQPPKVPGEITSAPDLSGVNLPNFVMPLINGGVSFPTKSLSPGAVTTTDTNVVCNLKPAATSQAIPPSLQQSALDAYGYTNPSVQNKYLVTFVVPLSLGGALTQANVWPAAVQGTGFFELIQLDHILKLQVCRRFITLKQAQRALESNWYAAWLKYVVATGHL